MVSKNQDKNASAKQKVVKLSDLSNYEEGVVTSKAVVERQAVSIVVYAFDRFQGIVEHILPYDALFYVLEGEAEVSIGGYLHVIKTGEMVMFPAKVPHSINAKSRFKMLLVSLKE